MSFEKITPFVILPNNALKEVLNNFGHFLETTLLSPMVLEYKYFGNDPRLEDAETLMKLYFLAKLRSGILPGIKNEPENLDLAEIIFGDPPFHLDLFDKWWTISAGQPPLTMSMDLLAPEHFLYTLKQFAIPDNPLAKHWLERILEEDSE